MRKINARNDKMRALLGDVQARKTANPLSLSGVPPIAYTPEKPRENAPIQGAHRAGLGDARLSEEIPQLIRSLEKNEGYRIGVLGESGAGKTSAIKLFLAKPFNGITLIHDEKPGGVQFAGHVTDRASLSGIPDNVSTVVFRGDPYKGTTVEVDAVCSLALRLARFRVPVRLVVDELDRAVTPGGRELASKLFRECITQGRGMGLCVLWSTQMPMRAPAEVVDNASAIVLGRCGPRSLNYLDGRCFFSPQETAAIQGLRGHYEDNRTVGELVVHQNGKPWNGTVFLND